MIGLSGMINENINLLKRFQISITLLLQNWFSCGDNWKKATPEKYQEDLELKLGILKIFM